MEWTKEKPRESGWYEFRGELHASVAESIPATCDPYCVVRVEIGRDSKLQVINEGGDFDFDSTDGQWRGPLGRRLDTDG